MAHLDQDTREKRRSRHFRLGTSYRMLALDLRLCCVNLKTSELGQTKLIFSFSSPPASIFWLLSLFFFFFFPAHAQYLWGWGSLVPCAAKMTLGEWSGGDTAAIDVATLYLWGCKPFLGALGQYSGTIRAEIGRSQKGLFTHCLCW